MPDLFESLQTLPSTVDVQILRLQHSPDWYVRLETENFIFEAYGTITDAVKDALSQYQSDYFSPSSN